MSQAFISYHRAQRKLARLIAHRIAADGHSVWWDRGEKPGDSWSEAVSTALANAACVVVIWSKQAAASPWVLGEATAGYGRGALVSVCADHTPPPSPFDKGPVIDMQDWDGAGADVAWIRLRDPVRAKLESAEKVVVADAPLPPPRPAAAPVRVGFSSAAMEPPPYVEEKRRGGGAGGFLTLLVLGGAAAAGWTWREQINDELVALRESWRPATEDTQIASIPPPLEPMTSATAAPPPSTTLTVEEPPPAAVEPAPPADVAATAPDDAASVIASAPRMTYDWRDAYVPPPTLRTLPAADERKTAAPPPTARAAFTEMPPLPSVSTGPRRVELHQGRFIELDLGATERKTDLWFAPDRTGYGLFLGVANGSRLRLVDGHRATEKGCKDAILRRNPIAARDLVAGTGLCVRTSTGVTSAWRVETVETRDAGAVLRLVAATP